MNEQKSYHHGDLRRALLDVAHETVRTEGASSLTLRGVARAANVSHAAPYHHFRDKEALLAVLAEEGFGSLRKAMDARAAKASNPGLAMQEAAIAYVAFAVGQPELFRIMFGPQLSDKSAYPSLQVASRAAYGLIEDGLRQAGGSSAKGAATEHLAVASWSIIHGLAMILIDGQFELSDNADAEAVARKVTNVFWKGLSSYGRGPSRGSSG